MKPVHQLNQIISTPFYQIRTIDKKRLIKKLSEIKMMTQEQKLLMR